MIQENAECVYSTDDAEKYFALLRVLTATFPKEPFVTIGRYQLWLRFDGSNRKAIISYIEGNPIFDGYIFDERTT